MIAQLEQDILELSFKNNNISDYDFAKWNLSAYHRIESVKKEVYIPEFYTDDELLDLIEVIKTQDLELPLTLGIIYGL